MTTRLWALLAGTTGIVANLLLIAMFTVPGAGWAGPANDIVGGIVSTAATIPVALAFRDGLRVLTGLAVAGMAAIVVLSVVLIAGLITFETQFAAVVVPILLMFGWVWALGRRRGDRAGVLIGAGAVLGLPLVAVAALLSAPAQLVVGVIGLILVVPAWLAFPVWLIRLTRDRRRGPAESPPSDRAPAVS